MADVRKFLHDYFAVKKAKEQEIANKLTQYQLDAARFWLQGIPISPWLPSTTAAPSTNDPASTWAGIAISMTVQKKGTATIKELYKPTKELPKELLAGPLVAHRAWRLDLGSGRLNSTGMKTAWPIERPARASCEKGAFSYKQPGPHEPPMSHCACGYHGLKQPAGLLGGKKHWAQGHVYGEVALWGKVIVHTDGYRAEYAWPMKVIYPVPMPGFPVSQAIRKELATITANYGCEVWLGDKQL